MVDRLLVDTWGWLTLYDRGEQKHHQVIDLYQTLRSQQTLFYTTDYILDETFTLLFKRLNTYRAKQAFTTLINACQTQKIHLIFIDQQKFIETQNLRLKYSDKPNISFTDLSSMVVMKTLNMQIILTEDDHFLQVGMGFTKIP